MQSLELGWHRTECPWPALSALSLGLGRCWTVCFWPVPLELFSELGGCHAGVPWLAARVQLAWSLELGVVWCGVGTPCIALTSPGPGVPGSWNTQSRSVGSSNTGSRNHDAGGLSSLWSLQASGSLRCGRVPLTAGARQCPIMSYLWRVAHCSGSGWCPWELSVLVWLRSWASLLPSSR